MAESNKEYDDSSLLNYAIQKGILSLDSVLNDIADMERKELLAQHTYAITKTTTKQGKTIYSTYLPKPDGERLCRRRNTLEELEAVIINFYKDLQEEIYIEDVFYEWINRKLDFGEIQKTSYDRYVNDYNRFFHYTSVPITRKKFNNITEDDLESYIKYTIRDLSLTRKAYAGLRTIIRGVFKYGKKKKYTSISITEFFGDLELPNNLFKRKIIDKEKEVFMQDEIPIIINYLKSNPDIYNLGILLTFQTGLRVGELSTLKKEDLHGHVIKIRRTEDKYRNENNKWVVTIKEHAKTDAGNRDLIIPSTALTTLNLILELNPSGTYLFEHYNKRIRGNTFNKRLSAICDKLQIPHRTMHKIRKTYGTTLIDGDVDEGFITEQMGHSDISTTKKLYYFSNKTMENKEKQIENAICF